MTQIFAEDGRAVPVTVIEAGPCVVVQRHPRTDNSLVNVQLGFKEVSEKSGEVNKPEIGHCKKAGVAPQRYLKEFPLLAEGPAVGEQLKADIFAAGEKVDVSGISKGKGFTGAMKRHNFHGGPASHGSMSHRRPASSGPTGAWRVFPGTKKPGHMGAVRRTTKGLTIIKVDADKNLIIVRGAIPGPYGGLVEITQPAPIGS